MRTHQTFTPSAVTKLIDGVNKLTADYIDYGMWCSREEYPADMKWWKRREERDKQWGMATLWPLPTKLLRRVAHEMGWRFVRLEITRNLPVPDAKYPAYAGGLLIMPRAAFNRGLAADLLLVSEPTEFRWRVPASARPHVVKSLSTVTFIFWGEEQVQMLEDWYAKCYRNPDVIKAITKRGHELYQYDEPLKNAA